MPPRVVSLAQYRKSQFLSLMWACKLVAVVLFVSLARAPCKADADTLVPLDKIKEFFSNHGDFDIACMVEHCLSESVDCLINQRCRDAIVCDEKCMNEWDTDTTPEKFHIQNCTNICAWTYVDDTYQNFLHCVTSASHQCIKFPPIPKTCRAPANVHPLKQLSIKDLRGDWWVVKGLHPVYDCYPCQKLYFSTINATSWNYSSYYQVYMANGSLSLAYLQTVISTSVPGSNISFTYDDIGLMHHESWWLVDEADDLSYILLYYCGNTLEWNYEGAQVLARNTTLSGAAYGQIAASYQRALGLKLTDFSCNTGTQNCPENRT